MTGMVSRRRTFVFGLPDFLCLAFLCLDISNDIPICVIAPLLAKYTSLFRHIEMYSNEAVIWPEKGPTTIHNSKTPALRSVELHMYTHGLLAHITAPALDCVLLYSDKHCEGDPMESLLDLVRR